MGWSRHFLKISSGESSSQRGNTGRKERVRETEGERKDERYSGGETNLVVGKRNFPHRTASSNLQENMLFNAISTKKTPQISFLSSSPTADLVSLPRTIVIIRTRLSVCPLFPIISPMSTSLPSPRVTFNMHVVSIQTNNAKELKLWRIRSYLSLLY